MGNSGPFAPLILAAVGAAGLIAALFSGRQARAAQADSGPAAPEGALPGLETPAQAAAALGLDPSWQRFLEAVAQHESRGKLSAENNSASEAAAAQDLYEAAQNAWVRDCLNPANWYTWGSGGWYGMLPVSAMRAFKGTPLACSDPRIVVHHPLMSTAAAVGYAQRLFHWSSWERSAKTWRALNRGWSRPGKMDTPLPDTDRRLDEALEAIGAPASWADTPVTPLPPGWTPYGALQEAGAA